MQTRGPPLDRLNLYALIAQNVDLIKRGKERMRTAGRETCGENIQLEQTRQINAAQVYLYTSYSILLHNTCKRK